jgi:NAD+ diphosphatase
MNFRPALEIAEKDSNRQAMWFLFHGDELLLRPDASIPVAESAEELPRKPEEFHVVGMVDNTPVFVGAIDCSETDGGHSFMGLREVFAELGEEVFQLAGRAKQILTWDRDHRYCGRCGTLMVPMEGERARRCPACGHHSFPRLSPAMITAVIRDDRILLARARRFPTGLFSVLAGFVEAGETLEECVRREIREEVDIQVKDIRYFGSQSWPFPHSLMVGFTARHAAGEIRIDESEISEARWFQATELPTVPNRASISRRLIDWFVETHS